MGLSCIKVDQGTSYFLSFVYLHSDSAVEEEYQATDVLFGVEFTVEVAKFLFHIKRIARSYVLCVHSKITHCLSFKMC